MKRTTAETIHLILCAASLVFVLFALSACTVVRYTDEEGRHLTIADIRVAGSAIDLKAAVPAVGTLEVTRAQGSPAETIGAVGDLVKP